MTCRAKNLNDVDTEILFLINYVKIFVDAFPCLSCSVCVDTECSKFALLGCLGSQRAGALSVFYATGASSKGTVWMADEQGLQGKLYDVDTRVLALFYYRFSAQELRAEGIQHQVDTDSSRCSQDSIGKASAS